MENILLKYMERRINQPFQELSASLNILPFITISREYGCPAGEVSVSLADLLNKERIDKRNFIEWKVISKEILHEAARELNLNPERILKIVNKEKRSRIDEILNALSEKYYQSDRKIFNTIATVIKDFAMQGHVIILGRGGVAITYSFRNALHIRLIAPFDWRINRILEKNICKSHEEAVKLAREIDYKRSELLNISNTKLTENPVFDITFNCATLKSDDIAHAIINVMHYKNMIK